MFQLIEMEEEVFIGKKVNSKSLEKAKSRILNENENMLGVIFGVFYRYLPTRGKKRRSIIRGLLFLTEKRLIFYSERLFGRFDQTIFPLNQINTINSLSGVTGDRISFSTSQVTVDVHTVPKGDGAIMVQKIRNQMELSTTPVVSAAPQISITDQILNLGKLRDEGLLSDDEFEKKKGELLKRI